MGWDNYNGKHCARLYGWLPASIELRKKRGNDKLTYLTLCDTNAIDIFMFEMEGVLKRDDNLTLTGVTICEMDEHKIPEIFKNVNPPLRESIVNGKIEDLLLFRDTKQLQALDPNEDVRDINVRRQLKMRRDALRLQDRFPFDMINFDPYSSILNPNGNLYKSFDKIFELQKEAENFLIFTTTPIKNNSITELFKSDFTQNIKDHLIIKNAAQDYLGTFKFDEINDEYKRVAIGVGKTIIAKIAIKHGFKSQQKGIFIYESKNGTHMLSSVTELAKSAENINKWYPDEIAKIIKDMPTVFTFEQAESDKKAQTHLAKVIASRDKIHKMFEQKT